MMFQIFATVMLAGVALYAWSQSRLSPKVSMSVVLLTGVGEYLVLLPEHAMDIAHFFGVGRGADLVFYVWILLSLAVLLNMHLKLRQHNERMVNLVRALALRDAAAAASDEPGAQA